MWLSIASQVNSKRFPILIDDRTSSYIKTRSICTWFYRVSPAPGVPVPLDSAVKFKHPRLINVYGKRARNKNVIKTITMRGTSRTYAIDKKTNLFPSSSPIVKYNSDPSESVISAVKFDGTRFVINSLYRVIYITCTRFTSVFLCFPASLLSNRVEINFRHTYIHLHTYTRAHTHTNGQIKIVVIATGRSTVQA